MFVVMYIITPQRLVHALKHLLGVDHIFSICNRYHKSSIRDFMVS